MARGRKAAVNDSAQKLIDALSFVKIAVKSDADEYGKLVNLTSGWVFANNGIIAAGMSLGGNDVSGYVDHAMLLGALNNVGKELTISSSEDGIEIKSGDYEVMVPNMDTENLRSAPPDAIPQGGAPYPIAKPAEFRAALEVAGRVVRDSAEHLRDAAIYNNGQVIVATNGAVVVEAWHGNNMPQGLLFPKAFATALSKTDKAIVGFTFDQNGYKSFTVWFEDQSFIRTNLYPFAEYPADVMQKYPGLFADFEKMIEVPKGFFEAVAAVAPFGGGEAKAICVTGGAVTTDYREGQGWFSHKAVKGLPEGGWVSGAKLADFADAAKVHFSPGMVLLGGNGWRAAIAGINKPIPQVGSVVASGLTATQPDPATAPAWGAAPAATPQQAPAAAPPAPSLANGQSATMQVVTLPFTPRSRQTTMVGAPGWDTTPYNLQPGETAEQFCVEGEAPPQWVMAKPTTPPTQPDAAPPATSQSPAPATTPASGAAPWNSGPTAPTDASPSDATGGFTPFVPAGQAGAGFTASPVQSQQAPTSTAPAGDAAPWQTTAAQSPSDEAAAREAAVHSSWVTQQPSTDFSAFAAFANDD